MKVEKAKEMGFCVGVRLTLDQLRKALHQHSTLESLGEVVHNRRVVEDMARQGVKVVDSLEQARGKVVAITAHGVGPQIEQEIEARGLTKVDTTCPFVRQAHKAAKELARAGFTVLIFGDASHPEVKGVLGWAGEKGIAAQLEQVPHLWRKPPRRLGVLSQTTQNPEQYALFLKSLVDNCLGSIAELRIINTICPATRKRQAAALELAGKADLMIVIGDRSSANTRYLAKSCASSGVETHLIDGAEEIDPAWLKGKRHLGITAGASTPDSTIEEVLLKLQSLDQKKAPKKKR